MAPSLQRRAGGYAGSYPCAMGPYCHWDLSRRPIQRGRTGLVVRGAHRAAGQQVMSWAFVCPEVMDTGGPGLRGWARERMIARWPGRSTARPGRDVRSELSETRLEPMWTKGSRRARERGAVSWAEGWRARAARAGLVLGWAASALTWAGVARAQEVARGVGSFPRAHFFQAPVADPREPQNGAGLIVTDLFDSQAQERPPFSFPPWQDVVPDVQGAVAFSANVPVWGRGWPDGTGGVVVSFQAGVQARFRIERPSRDMLGSDWMVAIPVEIAGPRASARIRLLHRSAHLGDELAATTGAMRIEYSHEALDALIAIPMAGGRVYGGGALIIRSITETEDVLK